MERPVRDIRQGGANAKSIFVSAPARIIPPVAYRAAYSARRKSRGPWSKNHGERATSHLLSTHTKDREVFARPGLPEPFSPSDRPPNNALQPTAQPLRGFASAELRR